MDKFGAYLNHLRKSCDYSLKKVHEKTGITNSRLSRIENGKNDIYLNDFVELINLYGVTFKKACVDLGLLEENFYEQVPLMKMEQLNENELKHVQKEIDFIIEQKKELNHENCI